MAQGFTRGTIGGTLLVTSSTYFITCSYSVNAVTASYAFTSSFSTNAITFTSSQALLVGPGADAYAVFYVSASDTTSNLIEVDRYDGVEVLELSPSGSLSIGTSILTSTYPETLKISGINIGSYNLVTMVGSVNNYLQCNLTNSSNGPAASADYIVTNDQGTEVGNYIDLGKNSSGYTASYVGNAGDGYLYNTGSSFYIGNVGGTTSKLYLFAGSVSNTGSGLVITTGSITSNVPFTASNISGTSSYAKYYGRAVILCTAFTPTSTGADASEVPMPYSLDGTTSISWSLKRFNFRVQSSGSLSSSVTFEKSITTGSFSAVTMETISLQSSSYETFTGSLNTINSGDKLRFNVGLLGNATNWTLMAEIAST